MSTRAIGSILLTLAAIAPSGSGQSGPAAIVVSVAGMATVSLPNGNVAPVRAFDWLDTGCVVESRAGATIVLAFSSGARYRMGAGAKLTIAGSGPRDVTGPVTPLAALPPMPAMPGIAAAARRTDSSAAIRLRNAEVIEGLYPNAPATALPDLAGLRFKAKEGVASFYRVELEDDSGNPVFQSQTSASEVAIPGGTLRPGRRYVWRVRSTSIQGTEQRGEAEFTTLTEESVARRAAFKGAIDASDPDSLSLPAEIDVRLGLLAEALDELSAAARRSSQPDGFRKRLAELEAQMSGILAPP